MLKFAVSSVTSMALKITNGKVSFLLTGEQV
jgi:hypothetical protein